MLISRETIGLHVLGIKFWYDLHRLKMETCVMVHLHLQMLLQMTLKWSEELDYLLLL